MNRVIKFRAWDGEKIRHLDDEKFWLFSNTDYFELQDHAAAHFDTVKSLYGHKNLAVLDNLNNSEATLSQYTGLNDKNGKEIYEGDIVKVKGTKRTGDYTTEIVWDRTGFALKENRTYLNDRVLLSNALEVIGNIFQNPELLK